MGQTRLAQRRDDFEQIAQERNERRIAAELAYFSDHPSESKERLGEIESEWSVERALALLSTQVSLIGIVLGVLGRRRWLLLSLIAQGIALQQALQHRSIAMDGLRRLGIRTSDEIERERAAIMAQRDNGQARTAK